MPIKYSDKVQIRSGPQTAADVWSRFPANAQSMASCPTMGSQPIKLFEANGQARWGMNHLGSWREVQRYRDERTGAYYVRMNGNSILPVAWASS
jgi:hypothetical protein